jgi:16S rRNA (cytosine967-C5)-methyltransferase
MEKNYRAVAVESLKKIFRDKSYSNIVINNGIRNLDSKYHSLYRKSVLGVIENLMFIDYAIDMFSKTKTRKMEDEVLSVLRLAVYQMMFLEYSYENAVVNESVQHMKDKGNLGASKFVNAVLRNILRNREKINDSLENLPYLEMISIKYSYPKWLVEKWTYQFGKEEIESVLKANNSEAPLEIRVNTLKISADELMDILNKKGIKTERCRYADKGIILKNPSDLGSLDEYKRGLFSIQSESSMLAGQVLNPREGSFIIDLCAAPGGKSLNAAEAMKNTGRIISRDIYEGKLKLIEKEAHRLGINNITAEVSDAVKLDETLIGKADFCIVDVPCTGLGIIRRKPEIKYNKLEKDIFEIQKMQYKILENASKYLKNGGELVYSTCTTNREENIDIIIEFLKNNPCYAMTDISEETKNFSGTGREGYIEIYPHVNGMDGFFIAKIKRL